MNIQGCRTYRAVADGRTTVDMPDGRSRFKVYYVSITGRDDPARYEWGKGPFSRDDFEGVLMASELEGIGFVTAFPHITKVFRFAPAMETVMHVRAFGTKTLEPLDLGREEGWVEFACYAEALIASDEYRAWAAAPDVAAYLNGWSGFEAGPIFAHDKLLRYWQESSK
jgi:hypothetical protein